MNQHETTFFSPRSVSLMLPRPDVFDRPDAPQFQDLDGGEEWRRFSLDEVKEVMTLGIASKLGMSWDIQIPQTGRSKGKPMMWQNSWASLSQIKVYVTLNKCSISWNTLQVCLQ